MVAAEGLRVDPGGAAPVAGRGHAVPAHEPLPLRALYSRHLIRFVFNRHIASAVLLTIGTERRKEERKEERKKERNKERKKERKIDIFD